tara:strand:- start:18923 stop:20089 length:1167 start_codon:yes stop_codon:yes gene_type:complete
MRTILYLFLFVFLVSCSSVKRSEKNLYSGNYDEAIRLSVKKIQNNRTVKNIREHSLLLEQAFEKAAENDLSRLSLLKKEDAIENSQEIYEIYQLLNNRQNRIKPLLPLPNVRFNIVDYADDLVTSINNYSTFLYTKGSNLLNKSNNIFDAREAHGYFSRLKRIQPNYNSVDSLLSKAHYKGTDFVYVVLKNRTDQVIPKRLEQDILDFDTYKLDNFWTEYHNNMEENIAYNYGITLEIREILVSPERINEKEYRRKKEIEDGWKYVLDNKGNVKKDSLGNDIKVDAFKTVTAKVLVSDQHKSALVGGSILYINLKSNEILNTYPIASEFVFKHVFAQFKGNKKALTKDDKKLLKREYVDFPTNEQMIYDTSTDLKNKFSRILKRRSFR